MAFPGSRPLPKYLGYTIVFYLLWYKNQLTFDSIHFASQHLFGDESSHFCSSEYRTEANKRFCVIISVASLPVKEENKS